jgi:amino acid transporter
MSKEKEQQVFFRQSTGLVKNVTLIDAISMNLGSMGPGVALAIIGFTTVLLPSVIGLNLLVTSVLAFALVIPSVIVYSMMTTRISRAGGDYVWISRTYGGLVGSVLAYTSANLNWIAYFALISLSAVFAIGSVGLQLGYSGFLGLALSGNIAGSNPLDQFVIASLIFLVFIVINIVRPKLGFRIVSILMLTGVVVLVIAIFTLLDAGRQGVVNYVNSLGIANTTYNSVAASYTGTTFNLGTTLQMIPFFMLLVFPWFTAGAIVGGELKRKTIARWNSVISAVTTFILVTGAIAVLYYVAGLQFLDEALANPTLVYNYSFNFWSLAMGVSGNVVLEWIIGLGWIIWTLGAIAFGVITLSRYLLAQSFDRLLPPQMAYVSPRYSSPVVAYLFILVVGTVLIGVSAFAYGTFVALYGAIVAPMFFFALIGIAAVVYGVRYEKSRTKTTLIVAGTLSAIFFSYVVYQFLAYPAIWGGNTFAYAYTAGAAVIGVIAYLSSKAYYRRKNVDIDLAFKEIPPE